MSGSDRVGERRQVDVEVEHAVKSFEESGKVPSFVLEASIFRFPYYTGRYEYSSEYFPLTHTRTCVFS